MAMTWCPNCGANIGDTTSAPMIHACPAPARINPEQIPLIAPALNDWRIVGLENQIATLRAENEALKIKVGNMEFGLAVPHKELVRKLAEAKAQNESLAQELAEVKTDYCTATGIEWKSRQNPKA